MYQSDANCTSVLGTLRLGYFYLKMKIGRIHLVGNLKGKKRAEKMMNPSLLISSKSKQK